MKPLNRIKTDWSNDLAYIVGLITTDGNLNNDGRHLDFTSKDIQLIKTFKSCLGLKNKIGLKLSGYSGRKCPHIQFGDVIFYRWLLGIGITPHKSKTIANLKIPNKYFFDFLRGHFDGDGCCYSYWDKRWHSSFMFYLTFASASERHVNWLRCKIKKLSNVNGFISKSRNNFYQLRYAKKESKILIPRIYYKKDLPHLERKYQKLKNILAIDTKKSADVVQLARHTTLRW